MITELNYQAKPFLKWAGGKGQLLPQLQNFLPHNLVNGKIRKYIEPFLGGGALFFWLSSRFDFESVYLYEINEPVYNCYMVIKKDIKKLIKELELLENEYFQELEKGRENFFYKKREEFNQNNQFSRYSIKNAALLIFLNKTCFNGLYRVNSSGEFNVPFGRYKNPTICNKQNLLAVHETLQKAEIICGDFSLCLRQADDESFVYFDPPYRPISLSSNFTSYSKNTFGDDEQRRLRQVFVDLDKRGSSIMLSNSDPLNINSRDTFFDDLYRGYHIERLNATRLINCNADRRGEIKEILVMNY